MGPLSVKMFERYFKLTDLPSHKFSLPEYLTSFGGNMTDSLHTSEKYLLLK